MKRPGVSSAAAARRPCRSTSRRPKAKCARLALAADVDLDAWFQQEFVRALFARAVDALRADYHARDRGDHLALFEVYDLAEVHDAERPSYKALADARGWAVHDVTNRLAATSRDFRAHVLRLLRDACASEDEYEREARAIFGG